MPATYDSQRLRNQRAMDKRLAADHAAMARKIAMLVVRSAGLDGLVPNTRSARETLRTAIWEQVVKPFYIGAGNEPLDGPRPQSPYALLLVEGITQATRIQAERQAAIVRRVVKDPVVVAWLTGPRPFEPVREMRSTYDPFHLFVDQNGYRLSDRVWRTSIDVRSRIDRLLSYHISRGTSAVQIADLLEPFLTPTALRQRTQTPYGTEGSHAARRLARTEITAAAGRATINASAANPFVNGVQWRLSSSHRDIDICNQFATGGPNGDGIYAPDQVPPYPSHPHEMCSLLPIPVGNVADLVTSLRADIDAARPRARLFQGILNVAFLVRAILGGFIDKVIDDVIDAVGEEFR